MDSLLTSLESRSSAIRSAIDRAVERGWTASDLLVLVVDAEDDRISWKVSPRSDSDRTPALVRAAPTSTIERREASVTCLPVSVVISLIEGARGLLRWPVESGQARVLSIGTAASFFSIVDLSRGAR